MKKVILAACLTLLVAAAGNAEAALSVTSGSYSYSQNFDTLAATGTTNAWGNDSTLAGWSLFQYTGGAITSYAAGTGSSNTGAFYSFGSSSERALGGLGSKNTYFGSPAPDSGNTAGYIAVAFTNNAGYSLSGFTIGFDGEQWRNGGASTGYVSNPQSMTLEYGFGSTFAGVTVWNSPSGNFDWTSPVSGTTAAAAVNGNTAGLAANRGGTISTNWAAGDTLWIRWIDKNDVGNDHALAIDNVTFEAVPTPIPAAAYLLGSGLLGLVGIRRRQK